MAINKVVYDGNTLIDITGDTVSADKLLKGFTAHDKTGATIVGTAESTVSGEVLTIAFGAVNGEVLNA